MKIKSMLSILVLAGLSTFLSLWAARLQSSHVVSAAGALQPTRQGAWLDSIVFTNQMDPATAITQLQAGELDIYASNIADSSLFQLVQQDPNLNQTESYGLSAELTFNPSGPTFTDGRFNPFSITRIRQAMNWLIDRDKIANQIFGGLASPKWLPLSPISADFTRFQSSIMPLEAQYAYNFSQAKAAITDEMLNAGASLQSGVWYYAGEPVTLIFIIREDDLRLDIGDYVSDQLVSIGFQVQRQYVRYLEANAIIYQGDPALGLWHVYTGGWISPSISRDDATSFGYFYTPLGSSTPLSQAYHPSPEFLTVCERLYTNDFSSMDERAGLFEQALPLSLNDSGSGSVHVWLVDQKSFTPRRSNIIVASDMAGNVPTTDVFPYVARLNGVEGGTLRIAQPNIFISPWNPIAGVIDLDNAIAQRATQDRGLVIDPSTGLYWPLRIERASVVVKEGLPITKTLDWVSLATSSTITVPGDAWVDWDEANERFITASEKYTQTITANSKVTVYYPSELFSTVTWHDGSPLSMGDFILGVVMRFDTAKPESPIYDESQVPMLDEFLSHFKGVKIESTAPLVISTWDDRFYLDAESMVQTWFPARWSSLVYPAPWHAVTAAIRAEAAGQLAFSSGKAEQLGVPWTDFVSGDSLAIMASWMNQSATEHYIPYLPTMGAFVNQSEADARWSALQAWYAARNHFWLGTGPFYLADITLDPMTITLAHYDAYPDAAGRWDGFIAPTLPVLVINHPGGAPGSYFNITGKGYSPGTTAIINVNEMMLGEIAVDSNGIFAFTLSTDKAYPGVYNLQVSVNSQASLQFTLERDSPVIPREGGYPVIMVPGGLVTHYFALPLVIRN